MTVRRAWIWKVIRFDLAAGRRFPLLSASLFLLLLLLAPRTGAQEQPRTTSTAQELEMCLAEAADYSPIYPTRVYPSNTRVLVAVYRVPPGEHKKLTAKFIAIDAGSRAGQESLGGTINASLTKNTDRGAFTLRAGRPLASGRYRLDVEADGRPWKSVEFSVAANDPEIHITRPEELIAFSKGRTWTYEGVLEGPDVAGGGPPGFARGPDGKLRGMITLTVVDVDSAGARVEGRMGAEVSTGTVWFRIDGKGLLITQRQDPARGFKVLDPPQVQVPWPLKTPGAWSYAAKGQSVSLNSRIWGPVLVKGPRGDTPGYIIMTKDEVRPERTVITAEQHFVPGTGLVREISITAVRDQMKRRYDMVLTEVK